MSLIPIISGQLIKSRNMAFLLERASDVDAFGSRGLRNFGQIRSHHIREFALIKEGRLKWRGESSSSGLFNKKPDKTPKRKIRKCR